MESRRILAAVAAVAVLMVPAGSWTAKGAAASLKASDPIPADGEIGVTVPLLQWMPGDTALWHNVYLGTDPDLGPDDLVQSRMPFTIYFHAPGLTPGTTYYWRVDEIEADMTTVHTGDVWSFTTLPWTAGSPHPPNGAVSVEPHVELAWTAGAKAVAHDVYLGTDETAVGAGAGGTFKGRQTSESYDPGLLKEGTTYYWRIDELGPDGVRHGGDVWHFTTAGVAEEQTYHVDQRDGSDENDGSSLETAFATIQRGIDAAEDGDTVLVYPGVYREPIDFLGKAITVRSAEWAAVLEVADDFAVSFYTGEGPASLLENFVIRNSFIGLFLVQSSPTIRNLTVVNNKYATEAYARAEPDISNCIFWYNTGDDLFGCEARYSCIERGSPGVGNFTSDPLFADPDTDDYHLLSERGRYWPEHDVWVLDEVTSPYVDAGDPDVDPSSERAPNGGRINLGAYGGTPYASMSEIRCPEVDNRWPTVGIVNIPDGAELYLGNTIHIEAKASDVDGFVVEVRFFANGDEIGADTNGTDGWAVDWWDPLPGDYVLIAQATDDDGAVTDSEAIKIIWRPRPLVR